MLGESWQSRATQLSQWAGKSRSTHHRIVEANFIFLLLKFGAKNRAAVGPVGEVNK